MLSRTIHYGIGEFEGLSRVERLRVLWPKDDCFFFTCFACVAAERLLSSRLNNAFYFAYATEYLYRFTANLSIEEVISNPVFASRKPKTS
jgi:hypothetical protein